MEGTIDSMRVLVCVASKHGATLGLGHVVARRLGEHDLQPQVRLPAAVTDLDEYHAVVLGSALYANRMMPTLTAFAHRWGEALAAMPTYLFNSGPLDLGPVNDLPLPKDSRDLAARIGARDVQLFAGRLLPNDLRASERAVMRMIGARAGDFRDFKAVAAWADAIAQDLATAL